MRGHGFVPPDNAVHQVYKAFPGISVDIPHHTEVQEADDIARQDKDVARVGVCMKETMVEYYPFVFFRCRSCQVKRIGLATKMEE